MGDIEIQIRRSTKTTDASNKKEPISSTSVKTPSITYQNSDQENKNTTEEKPNTNQKYWDYSISHGKGYYIGNSSLFINFQIETPYFTMISTWMRKKR
jgi:hypothetical protein